MKLLLLSFALLGIILIDVAQADTVEKREAGEEKGITIGSGISACSCQDGECKRCDENGCTQVSNCNGKREAVEKRDVAKMMSLFNSINATCKCVKDGHCLQRKLHDSGYNEVAGCGQASCYTFCDLNECRDVCDGHCDCVNDRCELCFDNGCEQTAKCRAEQPARVAATNCQLCDEGGCEYVPCVPECDEFIGDQLFEEKCTCKKDKDGKTECRMCGKYQCSEVPDCSRFAKCQCIKTATEDTFTRCYGYTHGKRDCRLLTECSDAMESDIDEAQKMLDEGLALMEQFPPKGTLFNTCYCTPPFDRHCLWCDNSGECNIDTGNCAVVALPLLNMPGRLKRNVCDCPSDGGLCKQCDFLGRCSYVKECGLVAKRETAAIEREADLL